MNYTFILLHTHHAVALLRISLLYSRVHVLLCSARSQLTDQLLSTHLYISAVNKPPSTKQRITTTRFNINLFQTLTKQGYIFLTERTVSAWLVGAAIPLL